MTPAPAAIRYKIEPRGIPPVKAARRLGVTLERFREKLPELSARGFPPPDPTTGNYDLRKIDLWMDGPEQSTDHHKARDAREVFDDRLARL